jgi:hypothetical protein
MFDIYKTLPPIEVAKKSIDMLSDFFFKTLRLKVIRNDRIKDNLVSIVPF